MVKKVDKRLYKNYLKKAEEMLEVAEYAANRSKNNAAVTAAIHCAISAIDSLAVFYFGNRHTGRHEDALVLIRKALNEVEFREITKQFNSLIELKNEAEYQPDLMEKEQADDAVKRASRILSKVREKLMRSAL
ncbi:MAG: HEPN domain-containing protein [Nitrososphaerales archaeon]